MSEVPKAKNAKKIPSNHCILFTEVVKKKNYRRRNKLQQNILLTIVVFIYPFLLFSSCRFWILKPQQYRRNFFLVLDTCRSVSQKELMVLSARLKQERNKLTGKGKCREVCPLWLRLKSYLGLGFGHKFDPKKYKLTLNCQKKIIWALSTCMILV